MNMIISYIALLVAGLALINLIRLHKQTAAAGKTKLALEAVKMLRNLIENIPKHRGMTNAYLLGDVSFRAKMENTQKEIGKNFAQLEQTCQTLGMENILNSACDAQRLWKELQGRVYSLQPPQSFELHSVLIQHTLYLLEDLTDEIGLAYTVDTGQAFLVETLTKRLPLLTESLGQARGIGTGVATRQHCDVATRVKLKYLYQNIQKIMSKSLTASNSNPSLINAGIKQAAANTDLFLDMLQKEIINSQLINIKPDDYYSQATESISSNFALIDAIFPIIEKKALNEQAIKSKNLFLLQILNISIAVICIASVFIIHG